MKCSRNSIVLLILLCFFNGSIGVEKDVTKLQIGVKHRPNKCNRRAEKDDTVSVHHKGYLVDGTVFDSSYDRGNPFDFKLGSGQVIAGWDAGVLGACIGEKRKLKIPYDMGYGEAGAPPKIPG
eukprot:g1614.t1